MCFLLVTKFTKDLVYTILFLIVVYFLKYNWDKKKLLIFSWKTKGPFALPFIGNMIQLLGNPTDIPRNVDRYFKIYNGSYRLWFGPYLLYMVQNPEEIGIILNSPKCLKKAFVYNLFKPLFGNGIFTAPVDIWRLHRKALAPTFNPRILNSYIRIFQEQSNTLVHELRNYVGRGQFDIIKPIYHCTLDIICETAMGVKLNNQKKTSEYVENIEKLKDWIFGRCNNFFFQYDFITNFLKNVEEQTQRGKQILRYTKKVFYIKKAEYEKNKERSMDGDGELKQKCFINHLLDLTANGMKFSERDCVDEINTCILAGSDTTASMIAFTTITLGMYPEIQDKVIEEIDDVFGDSNRSITSEDLDNLQYLERVIKETMRLFPVAVLFGRECTEDLYLNDTVVPKGVTIFINMFSLHRDSKIWNDPLKFNPDRFLPDEVVKRHPYSYIPFSAGQRNCFGIKFAMRSMKVTLVTLLREYKFKTKYKKIEDITVAVNCVTKPADGFLVEIEYRKPNIKEFDYFKN